MNENKVSVFLDSVKASVSNEEYLLIKKAIDVFRKNECNAEGMPWGNKRCLLPSSEVFKGIWNWDTAFHAMALSRFDVDFAIEHIDAFMEFQLNDGMFPDVVFCNGDIVDRFTKPPVMAMACEIVYKRCRNIEFLKRVYDKLVKNEKFWVNKRCFNGLFHYDASYVDGVKNYNDMRNESGWDNSVRWDNGVDNLWAIDLNCYMVLTYSSLEFMANELNKINDAKIWQDRKNTLSNLIEENLWNESVNCYTDRNYKNGEYSDVLTPASFMPLYSGISSVEHAKKAAAVAGDKNKFFPGMPTVSYDNPNYGMDYWRGPMWLNVAYFAAKGLKNYGYTDIADKIKNTILSWVKDDDVYIHENYNSVTGEGLRANFFSWSAVFVIEFILNM